VEPDSVNTTDQGARRLLVKLGSAILIALIVAALDVQFKGAWSPWVRRVAPWMLGAFILYLGISAFMYVWTRWRARVRERRLDSEIRDQVIAYTRVFVDGTSPSYAKSVGNMLNPLHQAKALDPRVVNAYGIHLATLGTVAAHVVADLRSRRLPGRVGFYRLSELHRDYVRLCCEISSAVSGEPP
jgi:hypothetical protein